MPARSRYRSGLRKWEPESAPRTDIDFFSPAPQRRYRKSRRVPRNEGEEIMAKRDLPLYMVTVALASVIAADAAFAHGLAGKRFFPATLVTDDPFVADELSLPTISTIKTPASGDEPATRETAFAVDVSKRITDNLGVGFGVTYKQLRPDGGDTQRGFDNVAASVKYKFYQ